MNDVQAVSMLILNVVLQKEKIQLRGIIGKLNFACAVVIPGKAFPRRLSCLTKGDRSVFNVVVLLTVIVADAKCSYMAELQSGDGVCERTVTRKVMYTAYTTRLKWVCNVFGRNCYYLYFIVSVKQTRTETVVTPVCCDGYIEEDEKCISTVTTETPTGSLTGNLTNTSPVVVSISVVLILVLIALAVAVIFVLHRRKLKMKLPLCASSSNYDDICKFVPIPYHFLTKAEQIQYRLIKSMVSRPEYRLIQSMVIEPNSDIPEYLDLEQSKQSPSKPSIANVLYNRMQTLRKTKETKNENNSESQIYDTCEDTSNSLKYNNLSHMGTLKGSLKGMITEKVNTVGSSLKRIRESFSSNENASDSKNEKLTSMKSMCRNQLGTLPEIPASKADNSSTDVTTSVKKRRFIQPVGEFPLTANTAYGEVQDEPNETLEYLSKPKLTPKENDYQEFEKMEDELEKNIDFQKNTDSKEEAPPVYDDIHIYADVEH
ncbi:unnamed protein product [Mytilus coruscus]|uniref:EMI domain-containing protein n=1 Tax=Mytilus coruscus TaxID=42192 RepID=A0A6J8AZ53_MYTCO|nr:unnamed protein product [Mytilus coruscus]